MTLKRFRARIKLPIGNQEVFVQADSLVNAKRMLEGQYGAGSVIFGQVELLSDE